MLLGWLIIAEAAAYRNLVLRL